MIKCKKYILLSFLILLIAFSSCNIFYIAVRNVPVFFTPPKKVYNKITHPINKDVRLSALWIGHSTVLIQMDDKVIITDPLLTETTGELARRVVEPGIDIKNIPKCDIILISHPHFDHLNIGSLEMLEKKSAGAYLVFPQGLENYLPTLKFNYVRMKNDNGYKSDYIGEEKTISNVRITTVYAQHWGGRYGLDGYVWGDKAYTGYIIEYNGLTVYFAGDTGYDSLNFKGLGVIYKVDLALIPIGPCAGCEQCGPRTHVFPPDAVMIFNDIKARWMIPIHYGTLYFAQAQPDEPLKALNQIIEEQSLQDKIQILKIGEQKVFFKK